MTDSRKVLFLELNEFNSNLLVKGAKDLSLKNLEKMLSFQKTLTLTDDTYESDFLEPWVQWVSIHTGVPSSSHQIKHLGDVPHLKTKQIWEELSEFGTSSGIWGAMNASRGCAEKCLFFLPDPWTVSEEGYPKELNAILDPIRYVSRNYLNRSNWTVLKKIGKFLALVYRNGLGGKLVREVPFLLKNIVRYKAKSFVFISFFDYLSTLLFLKYKKKYDPDFSLLFLNSLAHIQHHHWKELDPIKNKPIVYGLRYLDRILGNIFSAMKEDTIVMVTNALSQKNTNEERPWILYRQKDQNKFLKTVGIKYEKVEPLMTHDAHIFFANEKDAVLAKKKLSEIEILGHKLFIVEDYPEDQNKLFYRICFTDEVSEAVCFVSEGKSFRFFDLFDPIIKRTGKHVSEGVLFCNKESVPSSIKNHEIFHWITKLFMKDLEIPRDLIEAYQTKIPEKICDLEKLIDAFHKDATKLNLEALRFFVHKLAGSAAMYGYPKVSEACKKWESIFLRKIEEFSSGTFVSWRGDCLLNEIQEGFGLNGKK